MARTPMIERDLYEIVRKRAAQAEQKEWEYAYKLMLADVEDIQLFGMRLHVSWPDGLPLHFKTEDEMHAWARQKLAELRREPPDLDRKA